MLKILLNLLLITLLSTLWICNVNCKTLAEYAENGDCTFYRELEKIKNCGEKEYLISYGGKYCIKFGETSDRFNQDGKNWINGVRKCLMHKLLDKYQNLSCKALATYAFETHVDCYIDPGYGSKGLCSIWANQNIVGLTTTLEMQDFFKSPDAIKQIFATMTKCIQQYGSIVLKPIFNIYNSLSNLFAG